ncbi:MAG: hypothetical protein WAN51_02500 [Alphaproteobacteria bacterium]
MTPPFHRGQFVWCMFPYFEEPLKPGPAPHIGYVLDVRRQRGKNHLTVASLYTTTRPWTPGTPIPKGVIPIANKVARRMNQKGFVLDCRRIAFMPLGLEFFPALQRPDKGIVHQMEPDFQKSIEKRLGTWMKERGLVAFLGPDVPER